MTRKVTIIDYGVGNVFSVCRAFEYCGADVQLTDSISEILTAERLVIPGVGAFVDGMTELTSRNLIEPIKQYVSTGRPMLGICLGMQLLMDSSEEFGPQLGLSLIAGNVVAIPSTGIDGEPHKIPHIGWNELRVSGNSDWKETILSNTTPGSSVYFVHSFEVVPTHKENRLADCNYNGRMICAAVRAGSLYGCQFHPEKSGSVGLGIIQGFLNI